MEAWVSATACPDTPSHLGGMYWQVPQLSARRKQRTVLHLQVLPALMNTAATLGTDFLPQLNGSTTFVHYGQNDQVNASRQLHSEIHRDVLVQTPNANQLQWKPPSPHAFWFSLSYFLLATLQC